MRPRNLLIEDESTLVTIVSDLLAAEGYVGRSGVRWPYRFAPGP